MCVCHGHKIQPISFIELEIEFCLKTNLDFFFAQIPQRPTSGASLGISRMESLICRNSSQLELNRRIVNSGTASGKVGARTLQQNFFGKIELNRESRSVAHPPPLLLPSQSVILSSEENFKGRYVTSLVTRRGVVQSTGHWWVVGTVYSACTVGGSLLASSPTVVGRSQTHCTPVEPPHSSHLLAETLTTKIRKLLTNGKSLSQLMTRQEY